MSEWPEGLFPTHDLPPWGGEAPVSGDPHTSVAVALAAAQAAGWNARETARWRVGYRFRCAPWAQSHRYNASFPRLVDTLHCCCGRQTRGWVVDDRFGYVAPNGAIHERLVVAPTPLYAEGLVRFSDGSQHVTHGCRECLWKLAAPEALPEDLERHYCRDLAQFLYEEDHGLSGSTLPWEIFAFRIPMGLQVIEVGTAHG